MQGKGYPRSWRGEGKPPDCIAGKARAPNPGFLKVRIEIRLWSEYQNPDFVTVNLIFIRTDPDPVNLKPDPQAYPKPPSSYPGPGFMEPFYSLYIC